jgi:hypothetical protein
LNVAKYPGSAEPEGAFARRPRKGDTLVVPRAFVASRFFFDAKRHSPPAEAGVENRASRLRTKVSTASFSAEYNPTSRARLRRAKMEVALTFFLSSRC